MALSKRKIIKFIGYTLWVTAGIALVVFLIAAMRKRDDKICKGLEVQIVDVNNNLFADKNDVKGMLQHLSPVINGKPIGDFDLLKMEKTLEGNIWIKDAELFFDNNEVLRVKVKERVPIARIFTTANKSYYIDGDFVRLPLSTRFSAQVPVFTGLPLDKTRWNRQDSLLLQQVKAISEYVEASPFWKAQIEQVDYTVAHCFEIMPSVGNHIVRLGEGHDLERKFNNLFLFYKEVLAQTGWNKYALIDVQYKGQVVASRKYMQSYKPGIAQTGNTSNNIAINQQP